MVQDVCIYVNICSETGAKCVRKGSLSCALFANVVDFALFAGALCKWHRICVVRCAFLEFSGLTPSLLGMGADLVNFA